MRWTGPFDTDLNPDGTIKPGGVPPERWPYGPPEAHEPCCILWDGGSYCDCAASDASDGYEDKPQKGR